MLRPAANGWGHPPACSPRRRCPPGATRVAATAGALHRAFRRGRRHRQHHARRGRAMGRELGQPVVVENRAGAAGNIGAAAVARAQPDGYTLLVGTSATHGANPSLFARPGYDALNDFEPIALWGMVPNVLVVQAEKGARNVADLIAKAKASPGKLTYASAGTGTSLHLAGVMFERAAGVQLTHVPYKGGGPASIDLMGGVVDMMFDTVAVCLPLVLAGKERALAVAAAERHFALPDVPTFAELGFKGVEAATWAGLFAPKGTPEPVLAELRRASDAALADAGVKTTLRGLGVQSVARTGPAFRSFVQGEIRPTRNWCAAPASRRRTELQRSGITVPHFLQVRNSIELKKLS
ncbi:tripartite tricarboxylate transporter substrate binding protein [Ramlibacter terrae]|uniref:Tripartite tricarboxylate transporter substrate binding protein n=1 Tax=Ramlibacter terrae TaxID=2732511 RepID=A0ABX6P194_9BURK|nr:tripartite tricarboxylate transporter substrate binding protein [Ramlibacter terrae]